MKVEALTGWETEKDDDDDNFDDCTERFTKELLEFHQLEQFRFGSAAHSLQPAVKDAIRQIEPRPLLGDPPLDAPEPFRGLLLSDRYPIEPPQPYTAEKTRILCPLCRVPEISRSAHQDGSLHRSRLLAATIRDTIPRPPQPPPAPTTVEATVALLHSARPDLLAQGALPAST
ncbi:hypothetical protein HPB52_021118 [Rhipicephalus sanguineus]|uniref:Uncharacterized protein n=1 Tax=Rhipicephalus sanguineus TaxID=34632 RepID=A0A9D4PMV1_RHISA|nr:hypothetical protein HPB52_021118 [Rhipicephalus sanguineus]